MSSFSSTFRDDFLALRTETYFSTAPSAETIALRAMAYSSLAIGELFNAASCSFITSVKLAFSFPRVVGREFYSRSAGEVAYRLGLPEVFADDTF